MMKLTSSQIIDERIRMSEAGIWPVIEDLPKYLAMSRIGADFALNRKQRKELFVEIVNKRKNAKAPRSGLDVWTNTEHQPDIENLILEREAVHQL